MKKDSIIKIDIIDILHFLDLKSIKYDFFGEGGTIVGFSSLYNYRPNTITWCKNENIIDFENPEDIRLIVCAQKMTGRYDNLIVVKNPKEVFFSIIERYFDNTNILVGIGENSFISDGVHLGKNVYIGHNCVIEGDINIGDNTIIHNNVTIINRVVIGMNCEIQSSTVIGHDDFAYYENSNHTKTMIKHFGGVTIGNDVFVGAGSIINRGTIDDTEIGDGTKIDADCHISHNAKIGPRCAMISGTKIYGSVIICENTYIASSIVMNQIHVGKNVTIGMNSVVMNDVEDNLTVVGTPAKVLRKNSK